MSDLAVWSRPAKKEIPLRVGVLVTLFVGATVGGLLLVHARAYAPVLPLAITVVVVATAAITQRGDVTDNSECR